MWGYALPIVVVGPSAMDEGDVEEIGSLSASVAMGGREMATGGGRDLLFHLHKPPQPALATGAWSSARYARGAL